MAHLKNKLNDYVTAMGGDLFNETPKSVLAALAVSALTSGGDQLASAAERVAREWEVLHLNGIVPQKPSKSARAILARQSEHEELRGGPNA